MRTRANGLSKRTCLAALAALLLTTAACGGADEPTTAADPADTSAADSGETTTTTIEAPPETVVVTALNRVQDLVIPSSASQQFEVNAEDDQGYTFVAAGAFAIGNGQVDFSTSPPGSAQYTWDIAFDLTITNTTSGRQLPLESAGLLVWLPEVRLALDPYDVRVSVPFQPTVVERDGQISYESGLVPKSEHIPVDEAEANRIVALINAGDIEAFELSFETSSLHKINYVFDAEGKLVKTCGSDGSPLSGYFNCWRDG